MLESLDPNSADNIDVIFLRFHSFFLRINSAANFDDLLFIVEKYESRAPKPRWRRNRRRRSSFQPGQKQGADTLNSVAGKLTQLYQIDECFGTWFEDEDSRSFLFFFLARFFKSNHERRRRVAYESRDADILEPRDGQCQNVVDDQRTARRVNNQMRGIAATEEELTQSGRVGFIRVRVIVLGGKRKSAK